MPHRPTIRMAPFQQRNAVQETARDDPEQALRLAEEIRDSWFRTQSFGWVARYATTEALAERAFAGARQAAAMGRDSYQKSTPLAWPIRAAIETGRLPLAAVMFDVAMERVANISWYCSRASAIEVLFPAGFPGGRRFRDAVLARLPELCPVTSHWRAGRLHMRIAGMLAAEDAAAAQAFAERLPACKTRERILRDLPGGIACGPRPFFW